MSQNIDTAAARISLDAVQALRDLAVAPNTELGALVQAANTALLKVAQEALTAHDVVIPEEPKPEPAADKGEQFESALGTFVSNVQDQIDAHYAKHLGNLTPCQLHADTRGRKYIRIVRTSDGGEGQRSVFCFIERATGNVLKAASWKAPAKHARGTIYGDASGYGVTPYGANYL